MSLLRATLAGTLVALCVACAPERYGDVNLPLRNPSVPIGAITRFEPAKFDGTWRVQRTGGGAWALRDFVVTGATSVWSEGPGARNARIIQRATGILRLEYPDGAQRDIWVVWTDPDHHTVALGDPEGRFGFVATRSGKTRADQVAAALQVLDFNGYRTKDWEALP